MSESVIPQEIRDLISDSLCDEHYPSLHTLLYVSSDWKKSAERTLYRHIDINSNCGLVIPTLLQTVLYRPDIALNIKSLDLTDWDGSYSFLFSDPHAVNDLRSKYYFVSSMVDMLIGENAPLNLRIRWNTWLETLYKPVDDKPIWPKLNGCLALILCLSVKVEKIHISSDDGLIAQTIFYLSNEVRRGKVEELLGKIKPVVSIEDYSAQVVDDFNFGLKNCDTGIFSGLKHLTLIKCGKFSFPMLPSLEFLNLSECEVDEFTPSLGHAPLDNSAKLQKMRLKKMVLNNIKISPKTITAVLSTRFFHNLDSLTLEETLDKDVDLTNLSKAMANHLPNLEQLHWQKRFPDLSQKWEHPRSLAQLTSLEKLTISHHFIVSEHMHNSIFSFDPAIALPPGLQYLHLENVPCAEFNHFVEHSSPEKLVQHIRNLVSVLPIPEFSITLSMSTNEMREINIPVSELRLLLLEISNELCKVGVRFRVFIRDNNWTPWVHPGQDLSCGHDYCYCDHVLEPADTQVNEPRQAWEDEPGWEFGQDEEQDQGEEAEEDGVS